MNERRNKYAGEGKEEIKILQEGKKRVYEENK